MHFLMLSIYITIMLVIFFFGARRGITDSSRLSSWSQSGWRIWQVALFRMAFWGFVLCIGFLIADPTIHMKTVQKMHHGTDIMILIDVSRSMEIGPSKPTHLASAKQAAISFVQKMPKNRIGLVIFSGRAFLSAPLTHDAGFLEEHIGEIGVHSIHDRSGTAIGDAVLIASDYLAEQKIPGR